MMEIDSQSSLIERYLSRDILVAIFTFLPKKVLIRVMGTCKIFYLAAKDARLWRQLDFSKTQNKNASNLIITIVNRVARKGFVTHLNFSKNKNIEIWCIIKVTNYQTPLISKAVRLAGKYLVALNIAQGKNGNRPLQEKFATLFELAPNITDLNISNL